MANKHVIVVFKEDVLMTKYWTNIKDCCKDNNIPYWTVMRMEKPINYKDFKIVRLEK